MEKEIKALIEKNYKRTTVAKIGLYDDYLKMVCFVGRACIYPFIALRILNKYPNIRVVHFTGDWVEGVYTRETLKWAGYKVKVHKVVK